MRGDLGLMMPGMSGMDRGSTPRSCWQSLVALDPAILHDGRRWPPDSPQPGGPSRPVGQSLPLPAMSISSRIVRLAVTGETRRGWSRDGRNPTVFEPGTPSR
jgi:hypothetical protein